MNIISSTSRLDFTQSDFLQRLEKVAAAQRLQNCNESHSCLAMSPACMIARLFMGLAASGAARPDGCRQPKR
jgi:hypothetical protein